MVETEPVDRIQSELREGMGLPKCRKCGCVKEASENLQALVDAISSRKQLENLKDQYRGVL